MDAPNYSSERLARSSEPSNFSLRTHNFVLLCSQDGKRGDGAGSTDIMGQTQFGIFDLAFACLSLKMAGDLVDHSDSCSPNRMPTTLQATAHIDRKIPFQGGSSLFNKVFSFPRTLDRPRLRWSEVLERDSTIPV